MCSDDDDDNDSRKWMGVNINRMYKCVSMQKDNDNEGIRKRNVVIIRENDYFL